MTNTLSVERRTALERQAQAIGNDLDYQPEVMMEDIRLLPDSFRHENRAKGRGRSNEGVLNGISKFSSMPEFINEKLVCDNRKKQIKHVSCFDFESLRKTRMYEVNSLLLEHFKDDRSIRKSLYNKGIPEDACAYCFTLSVIVSKVDVFA